MAAEPPPFRVGQPLAWTFHRGTARWVFNTIAVESPPPLPGREQPDAPWTPLPPGVNSEVGLSELLKRRVSCRAFTSEALTLPAIATLLRSAYGVLGSSVGGDVALFDRAVPSAGGLYPLEVSLLVRAVDGLSSGVHHYVPGADGLEQLRRDPLPHQLISYLFMGQPWVAQAAVVVVLSGATGRTLVKYGDRGYRYLLLEAGHAAQNVVLTATALGLGAVCLGGFYDDELATLLLLDIEREIPLYAMAVGVPTTQDRMGQRALPLGSE
ncbi:MAG: SagB/ThcOx family dehydrogenase [Nitriliruptorales bacterium]|nr:SagB/ThcOx family dehydrogenase [Nitriliruptorales bacterium]